MATHRIGRVYVELDLDKSRYMRAQQTMVKESASGAKILEKNFKNLGIRSSATFDLMRNQAKQSFEAIKRSGRATTDDLVRAEKAKAAKITQINEQQYGHQKGLINNLKNHWKGYALAVTAAATVAVYQLQKISRQSIEAASDLEEVTSKFNTVFKGQQKQAEEWGKTLVEAYAMSTRESKQYLSSVQDLLVPMGMQAKAAAAMSNEVVKLAADLGSFNNQPTARVMRDIESALVGNFETMKKYGVILNETVLKQKALNLGMWDGKGMVDANTKAQVAFQLMLEGSTAAIGDMARTSDDYANQVKKLEANIEDLRAMFGTKLLPVVTNIVQEMNLWIKANDKLIDQKFDEYAKSIGEGIRTTVDVLGFLAEGVQNISRMWLATKKAALSIDILAQKFKLWANLGEVSEKKIRKELLATQQVYADVTEAILALDEAYAGGRKEVLNTTKATEKLAESLKQKANPAIEDIALTSKEATAKVKALAAAIAETNREVESGLFSGEWEKTPDQTFAGYGDVSGSVESMEELKDSFTGLDDLMKEASTSFDGQSFGDSLASGLNNAVISMNELLEMYEKQGKIEDDLIKQRAEAENLHGQDRLDALSKISNIETAMMGEQLSAWRQFFGTTKAMFEEGSKERELFAQAEMAATMAQIAVQAILAITTQGTGDPYTAWARIAAMAALMGTLVSQVGVSISGGGGNAPQDLPVSTVLGAEAGTPSESIANAFEMLEDINALQYRELRNIYHEVQDLNQNITGLVTSIVREGGIEGFSTTDQVFEAPVEQLYTSFHKGAMKYVQWVVDPISKFINDYVGQAIGWIAGKIFGGAVDISVTGTGIDLGGISMGGLLGGAGMPARQYTDIHKEKEGGWFGKDEHWYWTEYQELSERVNKLLTDIFFNLSESMVSISTGLGADNMQAVLDYVIEVGKVNLQNMNAEQVNEAISNMMSNLSDKMAEDLFGDIIKKYQQIDEGLYETAVRLVIEKEVLLNVLDLTGQAFDGTAREAVDFSQAIIEAAGGLENLTNIAEAYYEAFFTEAEKHELLTKNLKGVFQDMSTILPATREGYKDLVEGLDLTTDSGKEAYIALLDLAEASGQYYDSLEDATQQLADAERALSETALESTVRGVVADFNDIYEALGALYGLGATTTTGMQAEIVEKIAANEQQQADLLAAEVAKATSLESLLRVLENEEILIQGRIAGAKAYFEDFLKDMIATGDIEGQSAITQVLMDLEQGTLVSALTWLNDEIEHLQAGGDSAEAIAELVKQLELLQEAAERLAEFEKRQLVAMKVDMGLKDEEVFKQFRFDEITKQYAEFGRTFQETIDWFSDATLDDIKAVADTLGINWIEIANDVAFLIGYFEDAAALADKIVGYQRQLLGTTESERIQELSKVYTKDSPFFEGDELTKEGIEKLIEYIGTLSVNRLILVADLIGKTVDELFDDLFFLQDAFDLVGESIEDFAKAVKDNFAQIKEDIEFFNWGQTNPNATSADYWASQIATMQGRLGSTTNPLTKGDLVTMSELVTKWYDAAIEVAGVWGQVADSVESLITQVDNVVRNIKYSGLNVGLPSQKYQSALQDYGTLKAAAKLGGTAEIQEYLNFIQPYLQAAQSQHKSGGTYQDIYAATMSDLESIKGGLEAGGYDRKIYDELTNISAVLQTELVKVNATFLDFESWINLALSDFDLFAHWTIEFKDLGTGSPEMFATFLRLVEEQGWDSPVTLYFAGDIDWTAFDTNVIISNLEALLAGLTIESDFTIMITATLSDSGDISWAQLKFNLSEIYPGLNPEEIEKTLKTAYLDASEGSEFDTWGAFLSAWNAIGMPDEDVDKTLRTIYENDGSAGLQEWSLWLVAWDLAGMAPVTAEKTLSALYEHSTDPSLYLWSDFEREFALTGFEDADAIKRIKAEYDSSSSTYLPTNWADFEDALELAGVSSIAIKTIQSEYTGDISNFSDLQDMLYGTGLPEEIVRSIQAAIVGEVEVGPITFEEQDVWKAQIGLLIGILQNTALTANALTGWSQNLETVQAYWKMPTDIYDYISESSTAAYVTASQTWSHDPNSINPIQADWQKSMISILSEMLMYTSFLPSISALLGGYSMTEGTSSSASTWIEGIPWVPDQGAQDVDTISDLLLIVINGLSHLSAKFSTALDVNVINESLKVDGLNDSTTTVELRLRSIQSSVIKLYRIQDYLSYLPNISALLGGYGWWGNDLYEIKGEPIPEQSGVAELPRMVDYLAQIAANTGITAMALTQQTLTQQGIDPWATITATDYFTGEEYTTTQANWALKISQTAYDNFLKGYQIDPDTGEGYFNNNLWEKTTDPLKLAEGGVVSGPLSGFPIEAHGTEVIATIPQLNQLINGGSTQAGDRPLNITVMVGNEEFDAHIDARADNVRVTANRRPGNETRRLYR